VVKSESRSFDKALNTFSSAGSSALLNLAGKIIKFYKNKL
jgi:hypothetical protein